MTPTEKLLRDALEVAAKITESFCACDDSIDEDGVNFMLRQRAQRIRAIAATTSTEVVGAVLDIAPTCIGGRFYYTATQMRAALAQRPPEGNAKVGSIDKSKLHDLLEVYHAQPQNSCEEESAENAIITYIDAHSGKVEAICKTCKGSGEERGAAGHPCWICDGTGEQLDAPQPVAQVVAGGLTDEQIIEIARKNEGIGGHVRILPFARAIIATLKGEPQ